MYFFVEKGIKPLENMRIFSNCFKLIYNKLLLNESKEFKKKNFF